MPTGALTQNIDIAQVVLYAFWFFFVGLILYLRREDRREGYPCEDERTGKVEIPGPFAIPAPKTFKLPHGGEVQAPNGQRYEGEINATPVAKSPGSPLTPEGDPLLSGVGPAAYVEREDRPDLTREGEPLIVPLRVAGDFSLDERDQDPRGLDVYAADGKVAGTVTDIWVDRADVMVRYLEVELSGEAGKRLVPMPMLLMSGGRKPRVDVQAIKAAQFENVPVLADPDQVTVLEEDKIGAYYAGGRLYADPRRTEPVV